ncbi:AraC family transcriptional regulator [Occultella glacieicola]|uniref:AraC family transcriptional regulator n=1 Tax=Occultella glacieicola TaxID=2518684 RepID=A0ABY2E6T8_9MICO|nr:AraC family transcriptional regulator [Occultella glacieicola]TDE94993.1 AraC family transcriptional regulator [Occultella glacieicola]
MDALTGLLDGPRARGAFLMRSLMEPPWAIRIRDEAPLTVVVMTKGTAWILPDAGEPVRLDAGDLALVRGPESYTVAEPPEAPIGVYINPGQHCQAPDGRSLEEEMLLGVRTWGNDPAAATEVITGAYGVDGEVSQRLLDVLPTIIVIRAGDPASPATLTGLIREEIIKDDPGQDVVLDRMLDLLLIAVLRNWLGRPEANPPAWYTASSDPMVGHALRLLHNNPDHPWTVAGLAAECGVSRAAFARRFTELVGQAPMAYLTDWRLTMAADLLREPDATVAAVARRVGYASPFAFSSAFKRVRGISPQRHRTGAALAGVGTD